MSKEAIARISKRCEEYRKTFVKRKPKLYTQREWDRTVGIGVVPEEYKFKKESK